MFRNATTEDKFKVGDRVLLRQDSEYKHQSKGLEGKIVKFETTILDKPIISSYYFRIRWDHGENNTYRIQDIQIWDESTKPEYKGFVIGKKYLDKKTNVICFFAGIVNGKFVFELLDNENGVKIELPKGYISKGSDTYWCYGGLENQFDSTKPIEDTTNYDCGLIPAGSIKIKLVKDLYRNEISTKGLLPVFIPKGSITWINKDSINFIDRIITKSKEYVIIENNKYVANIPAEYFELVNSEDINLLYEPGKWYTFKNNTDDPDKFYAKCLKVNDYFRFNEFIRKDDGFKVYGGAWYIPNKCIPTKLEEIQFYLPDGHVDKIVTTKETALIPLTKEHIKVGTVYSRPSCSTTLRTIVKIEDNKFYYGSESGEFNDYSDLGYGLYLVSLPKEIEKSEEFQIPKEWCIKVPKNSSNHKELLEYRRLNKNENWFSEGWICHDGLWVSEKKYSEITYEQFLKYIYPTIPKIEKEREEILKEVKSDKPISFKVGDAVICKKSYDHIKAGDKGVIVCITKGSPPIGVKWENKYTSNHNCHGKCPDKYGYFLYPVNLELDSKLTDVYAIEIDPDFISSPDFKSVFSKPNSVTNSQYYLDKPVTIQKKVQNKTKQKKQIQLILN